MVVSDIFNEVRAIIGDCEEEFVYETLSDVVEALGNKGLWNPAQAYADFVTSNENEITLPEWIDRPIRININKTPAFTRGRLFEFKQNTDGTVLGDTLGYSWDERGEVFTQVVPAPGFQTRATVANSVRLFGIDTNGKEIFDAAGDPGYLVTTTLAGPTFKEITGAKKYKTTVFVDLYAGTTLISSYEPRDYSPLYRRIKLSGKAVAVRMLFVRRSYRIHSIHDWIPLTSALAIKLMLQAVLRWRKGQETDVAAAFQAQAEALLKEEQSAKNSFVELGSASEILTDTNKTYQTRSAVVVGDIYDEASNIFGPVGRAKLFDRISDSIELLANKSQWDGMTGFLDITNATLYPHSGASGSDGCPESEFTLPSFVETVEKVNLGGQPTMGQHKWFEFHLNGNGSCQPYGGWTFRDRGDYPTYRDITAPSQLIAELDTPLDNNKEVRIYGEGIYPGDTEAKELRQDGKEGMLLPTIYGSPLPDPSLPLVTRITRVVKDETTGYVRVTALDPSSTDGVQVALMFPDEVEPQYRRISIGLNSTNWIRILFRKKTQRVKAMTDIVPLYSKMAVIMAMRAVASYLSGDYQNATAAESTALRLLEEEQESRNPQMDFPIEVDMCNAPGSVWNTR